VIAGTKNPHHVVNNLKLLGLPLDPNILKHATEIALS
jgi:aryl-alcohol dehydrogenase-like predicted oxidoreductase